MSIYTSIHVGSGSLAYLIPRQIIRLQNAHFSRGILSELSVMVQASPMVRDRLGPALLHTYAAVKVFEGLDVDKENFDKYATRFEISQLLHRLWAREDCRSSILGQCGSKKFQVNSMHI